MMIRRKTLEVFKEKYPFLSYKPDHVRTEHFDGTREIMMYFDCIIDRGYELSDLQDIVKELAAKALTKPEVEELQQKSKDLLAKEEKASMRYLSEDYRFCYACANAGLKVWLCPWMKLQHVGTYVFGGSLSDLAQLGASATADLGELKKIKESEKREKQKNKRKQKRMA